MAVGTARRCLIGIGLVAAIAAPVASGGSPGDADAAALQVVLRQRGFYQGPVDGYLGPLSAAAVSRFQESVGLPKTGQAGPLTRSALGAYAGHQLGSRLLSDGATGWDVAGL